MVAVRLHEDGVQAVGLLDAQHFLRNDVGGFVPADAHILAAPPVLRVALALRVPVHPLHGVQDAVGRIHPLLVGEGERGKLRFLLRLEFLAADLDGPRVQPVCALVFHVAERARAQDAPVAHVDLRSVRCGARPAETHGLERRFDVRHAHSPLFVVGCRYYRQRAAHGTHAAAATAAGRAQGRFSPPRFRSRPPSGESRQAGRRSIQGGRQVGKPPGKAVVVVEVLLHEAPREGHGRTETQRPGRFRKACGMHAVPLPAFLRPFLVALGV